MKRIITKVLISLLLIILGGAILYIVQFQLKNIKSEEEPDAEIIVSQNSTTTTELEESLFMVLFSTTELEQGETLIIVAENIPEGEKITGKFSDKSFDFFPIEPDGKWMAIIGIDAKKTPGEYPLSVFVSGESKAEKIITVKKKNFYITKIVITPDLEDQGFTSTNISETISTKDGVAIYEVLGKYSSEAYFNQAFVYPLKEIVNVGAFGNIRKDGGVTIQHLGVDLDAVEGTSVYAINDGKVAFVQALTVYGNTLIIDHGLGIYSLYLHLSEFKVAEGETVERGEIIGLSGNTGWSVGPHLHLSIKAYGASVDPLLFIEEANRFLK